MFKMKQQMDNKQNNSHTKMGKVVRVARLGKLKKRKLNILNFVLLKWKKMVTKYIWLGWWEMRDLEN